MAERKHRPDISAYNIILFVTTLLLGCVPSAATLDGSLATQGSSDLAQPVAPASRRCDVQSDIASENNERSQRDLPAPTSPPAPAASPPAKSLVRGVWVHPDVSRDEATGLPRIRKMLDAFAQARINTVILMVKDTSGYVYYKSAIGVADPAWNYDCLDAWLKEAAKRNITVHPWFCVFNEGAVVGRPREHLDWFVTNRHSERTDVLNPALPEARQYELSLMMEVAAKYPVDWIHLDYIRFPCAPTEPYFSYDAQTRRLFKEHSGWDLLEIKAQDSGNIIWNEWLNWNRDQVTRFVRELREALKTTGRTVRISAAVFPDGDNARVLIGQDWPGWAGQGLVDMLCPMLYTNHAGLFEKHVRQAVACGKGHCLICPGIGIGTSHNQNTPEGMLEQMRISDDLGADGVIYFSGSSLNEPFIEKLKAAK
jgi:uncharacterized lipoprotein YddW (UPF0748 family)